jgi:hypothetical protein
MLPASDFEYVVVHLQLFSYVGAPRYQIYVARRDLRGDRARSIKDSLSRNFTTVTLSRHNREHPNRRTHRRRETP